jgi:hypothetical protein
MKTFFLLLSIFNLLFVTCTKTALIITRFHSAQCQKLSEISIYDHAFQVQIPQSQT